MHIGIVYKWKNYFSEVKMDVGMSPHENEGEQKDACPHKDRKSFNPIPTFLFSFMSYLTHSALDKIYTHTH